MKGREIRYSAEERAWIRENGDWPRRQLHAVFVILFQRHDVTADHVKALCARMKLKTGRSGQFVKGGVPANKGKPRPFNANSAATQFKKGERRGVAVRLYKAIGTERLSKEGYLERKIHDGLPLQSRWRAVHLLNWEAVNGSIPAGHCLKCLDGDRLNTAPDNWELISRAMLPRLNGGRQKTKLAFDEAASELKPIIMSVAKLEQGVRDARKGSRK